MHLHYYSFRHVAGTYQDLPGMRQFRGLLTIYGQLGAPIDRSGVLKFPVQTTSVFPLPEARAYTETFEQTCDARAANLLALRDALGVPMRVMWSGGVDSTCMLISLLKQATRAQRDNIIVLLSGGSVLEYPAFFHRSIRGRLHQDFADLFPHFLGKRNLIVSGEHADQLFGSDIVAGVITRFGAEVLHEPYDRDLFATFLGEKLNGDLELADSYVRLFERLKKGAPIPLETNHDLFWWINFALKWQSVYMRVLARSANKISPEWPTTYYQCFYNTENFQLWSMNNLDKRIKDTWASYKWPAKDVIYNYTKDEHYHRTKIKRGSLQYILGAPANFMDETYKFYERLEPEDFYVEENEWTIGR